MCYFFSIKYSYTFVGHIYFLFLLIPGLFEAWILSLNFPQSVCLHEPEILMHGYT
jgi:hypothetical protein